MTMTNTLSRKRIKMYNNAHLTGVAAAAGVLITTSGWTVAGYGIIAGAVLAAGTMTVLKLRKK